MSGYRHARFKLAGREDEIAELYRGGASQKEIAARFGCSAGAVWAALGRAGVLKATRAPSAKNATRNESIVDAYRGGESAGEIADRHGVTTRTVYDVLRRSGITRRSRKKEPPPRTPCRCGCGLLANPGNVWIKGHHRRVAQRERRAAAEAVTVERAHEESCQYRSVQFSSYGRDGKDEGAPAYSSGAKLAPPLCGKPVTLAGARYCDEHASLAATTDYVPPEELALRLRQTVTVSCAKCGLSWASTAMKASVTFAYHTKVCAANVTPYEAVLPKN